MRLDSRTGRPQAKTADHEDAFGGIDAKLTRPVGIPAGHAALLALSDERDQAQQARLAAWREGYACGAGEQYAAGYAAAVADIKRTHHDLAAAIRLGLARSAPAGAAWFAAIARNGFTEYGGAGQPRVPVAAVDTARVWQQEGGRP